MGYSTEESMLALLDAMTLCAKEVGQLPQFILHLEKTCPKQLSTCEQLLLSRAKEIKSNSSSIENHECSLQESDKDDEIAYTRF